MISNTKCKNILNKKGIHYTDKEVVIIKNALCKIAEVFWRNVDEKTKSEVPKNDILKLNKI